MKKKKFDFGSPLLVVVILLATALLFFGEKPVVYEDAQIQELTSCGLYDDGIFEYDTLEFYAVNRLYESEYLTVPEQYMGFTVDSVDTGAFTGTPVKYVLLPDTIVHVKYGVNLHITMFTDDPDVAEQCRELGFAVGSGAEYHALLEEARGMLPIHPANVWKNVEALAGTPWCIAVVLGLYALILLCAKLREKAGHDNPLDVLKDYGNPINVLFVLTQVMAAFLVFYVMLFETEEIGFDSEAMMEVMLNWPVKVTAVMFGLVLIIDLFYKNFFPWYLGRVFFRGVRMLIAMGIGAALGAFLGTVSLQFRFLVHLIAAAPIPLIYLIGGCLSVVIYIPLGIFARKKRKKQGIPGDFSGFPDSDDDYTPVTGGTTTLIDERGNSYPVHNVGYGYMVNGRMLLYFDPHGDNDPVDEDGNVYTRY